MSFKKKRLLVAHNLFDGMMFKRAIWQNIKIAILKKYSQRPYIFNALS